MAEGGQPPFRFGEIVAGAYFADREAETQALAPDFQHGQQAAHQQQRRDSPARARPGPTGRSPLTAPW